MKSGLLKVIAFGLGVAVFGAKAQQFEVEEMGTIEVTAYAYAQGLNATGDGGTGGAQTFLASHNPDDQLQVQYGIRYKLTCSSPYAHVDHLSPFSDRLAAATWVNQQIAPMERFLDDLTEQELILVYTDGWTEHWNASFSGQPSLIPNTYAPPAWPPAPCP